MARLVEKNLSLIFLFWNWNIMSQWNGRVWPLMALQFSGGSSVMYLSILPTFSRVKLQTMMVSKLSEHFCCVYLLALDRGGCSVLELFDLVRFLEQLVKGRGLIEIGLCLEGVPHPRHQPRNLNTLSLVTNHVCKSIQTFLLLFQIN